MTDTPWTWLNLLLDCAATELDTQTDPLNGAPARQFVWTGAEAWDDCCDPGGQVWTRVRGAEPQNPLGTFDPSPTKCFGQMGVHIGVGALRCAHTIDDQGLPPTADELTADARQVVADMVDLRRAIVCCTNARVSLQPWVPLDAAGGCIGGEWGVWVPADFTAGGSPGSP